MKHRKYQPLSSKIIKPQRKVLKVFTEGEKTEVDYIKYWKRIYHDRTNLIIEDGKAAHWVPFTLVNKAIKDKKQSGREVKSTNINGAIEYWCVFDVNTHPNLREAVQIAEANDIRVAVSNPCIELWFILHFQEQASNIAKDKAQSISKDYLKCGKNLNQEALRLLEENFCIAKKRAKRLRKKHRLDGSVHEADGSSWRSNPSSDLFELIDRISGGE